MTLCTFTGSIEDMATSRDFYDLFKSMFNLEHLGLWWSMARTQARRGTEYSRSKFVLHAEIDSREIKKAESIRTYFSKSSKKVDDNLLGAPLTYFLAFTFQSSDKEKQNDYK